MMKRKLMDKMLKMVTVAKKSKTRRETPNKSVSLYAILLIPLLLVPIFGLVGPIDRMLKGEAGRLS